MTRRRSAAASLLVGLLSIAAGRPVAMRVEIEPTGAIGQDTGVTVTVRVAPEDRARIGRDVWIQCEVLRRGERVDRFARSLDLDDNGEARFEAAWPAGQYELRVEISGPERGARGVWAGPITVPPANHEPAAPRPTVPAQPTPAPSAPAAAAGAAATTADEARGAPTPAAPAATAEVATPPEPEETAEPEAVATDRADESADEAAAMTLAAAAAVGTAASSATPPDNGAVSKPPEPEPAEDTSEPPERTAEAATPASADQTSAVPVPVTSSAAATTGAATAWSKTGGTTADVTVVVTEQNRPILGLGPSAFELKVGKNDIALNAVGDQTTAPLNLGIIVDLAAGSSDLAAEIAQRLGSFSLRTRQGGDLMLVTSSQPTPEWGATADDIARSVGSDSSTGSVALPTLLTDALRAFDRRRGRSFLVVLSDGHEDSDKSAWKDAISVAEQAGVVVYVVGVRDTDFASRARSSLTKIAAATGGRSYFLGNSGITGMTLDYLGELIDASYALPYPASDGPADVKVEVANRGWDVAYPDRAP